MAGAREGAQLTFILIVAVVATRPLQSLPRCVPASIVFTIAVSRVDVRAQSDEARESGRISPRLVHGGGGASDRLGIGHSPHLRSRSSGTAIGLMRWRAADGRRRPLSPEARQRRGSSSTGSALTYFTPTGSPTKPAPSSTAHRRAGGLVRGRRERDDDIGSSAGRNRLPDSLYRRSAQCPDALAFSASASSVPIKDA